MHATVKPETGRGRHLTELRRSNAAGPHARRRPGRANEKRRAIRESLGR